MIFCPLPGTPLITQGFGQNPSVYAAYGLNGHNGFDFGCDTGTIVYAPHDGIASVTNDGSSGYGLYVVIEDAKRKSLLAHLFAADVSAGQFVYQGDPIGKSGNSGSSTGPHLHFTYKIMSGGQVQNQNNGYAGAMDLSEFIRLWLDQDQHFDSQYTSAAQPYLSMTFPSNVYLDNPARNS